MPDTPHDPPQQADSPWQGDACSLIDAFRAGERTPSEELEATLAAIDASHLNAFSNLHRDEARRAAAAADVSKPFGGVPNGFDTSAAAAARRASSRWRFEKALR